MRRRRLLLAALAVCAVTGIVLLGRSPGGSGTPPAAAPAAKAPAQGAPQGAPPQLGKVLTNQCTAVSGGFRGCTAFHVGGEMSRIERRDGSRWSVVLTPDRAPYPRAGASAAHVGYWQRVFAAPRGGMVLAQWSAECEVPFAYLIATRKRAVRPLFPRHEAVALGWTSDGLARVRVLGPVYATKTRIRFPSGIYLVTPLGHVVRLERQLPPTNGC